MVAKLGLILDVSHGSTKSGTSSIEIAKVHSLTLQKRERCQLCHFHLRDENMRWGQENNWTLSVAAVDFVCVTD